MQLSFHRNYMNINEGILMTKYVKKIVFYVVKKL
jgi:hypothetical protein